MLDRLRSMLLGDELPPVHQWRREDVEVAAAALLIEAARVDGRIDPAERATIAELLGHRFGLDPAAAEALMDLAARESENSVELHRFAHIVNQRFSAEARIELIEMLWAVVYADGVVTDFEANLLRRVAGLLYVEDHDRGAARKRVLARLGRGGPADAGPGDTG
jgi:uncharacterized tellurite resistance protein B-like protein